MPRTCPYLEAKGWHMFVAYWRPDGGTGYSCHGCGEMTKPVDTRMNRGYTGTNDEGNTP